MTRCRAFASAVLVATVSVGSVLVGTYSSTPASAASSDWTLMNGPAQQVPQDNVSESVSCTSSTFCLAVGPPPTQTTPPLQPQAQIWDGTSWTDQDLPVVPGAAVNQPTAVSCVTSSFCMVMSYGDSGAYADEWNGTAWTMLSVEAPPDGTNALLGSVDCLSPTECQAVGQDYPVQTPLAERWDGSEWTIVPSQNAGSHESFHAVSCVAANDCWAVGEETLQPLTEHFDGSAWSIVATPLPDSTAYLISISCASSSFCEAVGKSWLPGPPDQAVPLVETWDGSSWSISSTPVAPSAIDSLSAVDCYSDTSCLAVGLGPSSPLVLGLSGGAWVTVANPPPPPGEMDEELGVVSCVTGWACVVGGVAVASGDEHTFFTESSITSTEPPTANITTPSPGETYAPNQVAATSFSCDDGIGGPGIATCLDSNGSTSPATLDTSSVGTYAYSVTATSNDGLSSTTSVSYSVADPPSATITTPTPGGVYNLNQSVPTEFTCSEGEDGPGLADCVDAAGSTSPSTLNTSTVGSHTYLVRATSADGLSTTSSISYMVLGPPSVSILSGVPLGFAELNQPVAVRFVCADDSEGAPGIATCLDSNGSTSPGLLDTSSIGSHTYTATATSADGQSATDSYSYNVATPPSATITAPAAGGTYLLNETVTADYSCSEGAGGTGMLDCSPRDGSTLDTSWPGAHTYSVTAYSHDGLAGTASISYRVINPTTTTLSASSNPAPVGEAITYTVQVSPIPDGGTIDFSHRGTALPGCRAVPVNTSTGKATCTDTYQVKGWRSIVATYSGDAKYQRTSSAVLTEKIGTATRTRLSAAINPVSIDQPVIYSAQVRPVPDGGTVSFTDNGTTITGCSVVPVNASTGKALCHSSYSVTSVHSIIATYSGDTIFRASTSANLKEGIT